MRSAAGACEMIPVPFMRRLVESLIHRCRVASPAALVVLVITTLLLLAYRVDVLRLIQVSYPELSQLTFGEFLAASAKGDATMVLLVSLVSWALLAAIVVCPTRPVPLAWCRP